MKRPTLKGIFACLAAMLMMGWVSTGQAQVVINEIMADPTGFDSNGDGVLDTSDDEYFELINNSGSAVDLTNWQIDDAVGNRHTFGSVSLPAGGAIVIFGGGTPTGSFGGAITGTASAGFLGFNNGGDTVTLLDAGSTTIDSHTYGAEGGNDESLTRDPDITGTFVGHTSATGSGGSPGSPGTNIDGSPVPVELSGFEIE